ncbi:hypothetical protein [Cyclobacterium marinum]|uniref:PepSY domain-containing protein n=1 Tax=Cyclobacterium marinum (strain ATCC 25205 / DSM 745 / LMG 13164 / NCIMB 1802) TaxID=880070 RepID=G0J307_CYCMS|nr:hypothetical protein [Cyclobacterium marinum]AEL28303.1 hypothetical protein Cycma_4617 [Cyclobacterium marinum DSM 745]|tara:strand:+ start:44654 stop:44989 length:336 start_codon:yes stop_codon:yes gene_type:complete
MKKLILSIAAMTVFAFANAGTAIVPVSQEWYQETTKIDPESLPDKVKEAIQNDLELKDLKISEAHQVTEEGSVNYLVKFESTTPGEEIKKKFDAMGKEILKMKAPLEPVNK